MLPRKIKSGFQKRKERKEREEREKKGCQPLTDFFTRKDLATDESAASQSPHTCTPPCPSEEVTALLAHGEAEVIQRRVGQNVTLQTGVTGLQADDDITCSVLSDDSNKPDTLGTYLNRKLKLDYIDRFKGRLHLQEDSGSLTITNLNMNDTAFYQVQIINGKSSTHTFSLIVEADPAPSSTTPPLNTGARVGLAIGIPAALLVAAVIVFCLYRAGRCGGSGRGYRGCARGHTDACSSSVV